MDLEQKNKNKRIETVETVPVIKNIFLAWLSN